MEKHLKDYAHLYLGCEMILEKSGRIITIYGIKNTKEGLFIYDGVKLWNYEYWPFKLLLRPLSNMTEDEIRECAEVMIDFGEEEVFRYKLSKHLDIFGLIEIFGLAIDKTTL